MFEEETPRLGLECVHMLTAVVPEDGLGQGYGKALDFVFDSVIRAFEALNTTLRGALDL